MKITTLAAALALGTLASGAVYAQTAPATPAATTAPQATAAPTDDAAAKKAKSADCYKQADAQNLHGKYRRKFHRDCIKGK
ncbi:MAG: phosphate starvation-inducible protein PsiF [Roseiarcus sp.]